MLQVTKAKFLDGLISLSQSKTKHKFNLQYYWDQIVKELHITLHRLTIQHTGASIIIILLKHAHTP